MIDFFIGAFGSVGEAWISFSGSIWFFIFKILAAIYTTVVVVDVVLLIYLGDVRKQVRAMRTGTNKIPVSKREVMKKWKFIANRLSQDDENEWKVAILEADHVVNQYLAQAGYHGENFAERLGQIPDQFFINIEAVKGAHELRNGIIRDQSTIVTQKHAEDTVDVYYDFLESLGII